MSLTKSLKNLAKQGCYPCISYRGGGIWRAHVNGAGNYWANGKAPFEALENAVQLWLADGKPVDGYAGGLI